MSDIEMRSLERAVNASPDDTAARLRYALELSRAGKYADAKPHAVYVLKHDRSSREALQIILPLSTQASGYQIGTEIQDLGKPFHTLTKKPDNIDLGTHRAFYELGLIDKITGDMEAGKSTASTRAVWNISHQNSRGNVTADAVRYGLTMKDVETLVGKGGCFVDPGLTENDTIVEWVTRPKGFKKSKSGIWSINFGDGTRYITKFPEGSGWVVWPDDRPPYTDLGIPSGKTTQNRKEAAQSMIDSGIPPELTETETTYFWGMPNGYKDVVAVGRWVCGRQFGPFDVVAGSGPDDRYSGIGWFAASRSASGASHAAQGNKGILSRS